jgi:hypothetical protein
VIRALGFTRDKTPAVSTLHLVFTGLDVEAFEKALSAWACKHVGDRGEAIAIDGKHKRPPCFVTMRLRQLGRTLLRQYIR